MPGNGVSSDEELLAFARETGVTIFHPVGTCKMGPDGNSVVDHRLLVHHDPRRCITYRGQYTY